MIVDFAVCTSADVLVMGSTGCKDLESEESYIFGWLKMLSLVRKILDGL